MTPERLKQIEQDVLAHDQKPITMVDPDGKTHVIDAEIEWCGNKLYNYTKELIEAVKVLHPKIPKESDDDEMGSWLGRIGRW